MGVANPDVPMHVPQYAAPTAGQTVTVAPDTTMLVVNPAGLLATLTINMPSVPVRGNGHAITIASTQIVTTLTLGAGAGNSVAAGAIAALAVGGFATYVYRSAVWYRCG
jgi:hypothetical protein